MHQVFEVSSALQLLTIRAALDAGLLPTAEHRTLVAVDTRVVAEVGVPFHRAPALAPLLGDFDRVVDLGELIHPLHPLAWDPPTPGDLRPALLGPAADDDVTLFLASLDAQPSRSLSRALPSAVVHVHGADLRLYGPADPDPLAERVAGLLYADLVPGARPLRYLARAEAHTPVPAGAMATLLRDTLGAGPPPSNDRPTVIVGQHLGETGVLPAELDADLHLSLVDLAARRGATRILFAPHPAAATSLLGPLLARAEEHGIPLELTTDGTPVEVLVAHARPGLVLGCSSTALVAAHRLLGVPTEAHGTDVILEEARPFENAGRIPAVVSASLFDEAFADMGLAGGGPAAEARLGALLEAVTYAMEARRHPELHDAAAVTIEASLGSPAMRFFKRRRLSSLGLPGGLAAPASGPLDAARKRARGALSALRSRWGRSS